jgi:hypothetical protein
MQPKYQLIYNPKINKFEVRNMRKAGKVLSTHSDEGEAIREIQALCENEQAFDEGYQAGLNSWRYNPPDFRTNTVANEAYNKGWKEGCQKLKAWDKSQGFEQ